MPLSHLFKSVVFRIRVTARDPAVRQELVWSQPLFRIGHQQVPNHVFCVLRDVFPGRSVEVVLNLLDLLEENVVVLIEEGRTAAEEDEQDNANAPKVARDMIWLLLQNFRSHVSRGATSCGCEYVLLHKASEAEVTDFQGGLGHVFA